ncbi:MAG TPA: Rieske 2Fe-2S domain-containing protein [Pseudonocardiaceae bacterium]
MVSQRTGSPIVRLGQIGELFGDGARAIVTVIRVDGSAEEILVVRARRGRLFAVLNRCPHRGRLLDNAPVHGRTLTCPGHGRSFDLRTGRPGRTGTDPLPVLRAWLEDDQVFLRLGPAAAPRRWWRRVHT